MNIGFAQLVALIYFLLMPLDDFDFQTCLYNFSHCNKHNPNLIMNSHQLCITSKYKPCNSDIDPDKFYYNQMQNETSSPYYLEDEFNSMLIKINIDNNFSVLHVNARSLHKNLDYLQVYLRTLNHNFSIIAISETWANNDSMLLLNIPGYNRTFKNRTSGRGGGVALFVCNCFKFTVRDDLSEFNNDFFESIFIELTNTILGNRIIGAVYRPPGYNPDLFMIGFVKVKPEVSVSLQAILMLTF